MRLVAKDDIAADEREWSDENVLAKPRPALDNSRCMNLRRQDFLPLKFDPLKDLAGRRLTWR